MSIIEGIVVVAGIIAFTATVLALIIRSVDTDPEAPTRNPHMPTALWSYDRRHVDMCQCVKILPNHRAKVCTGDSGHETPHTYMYTDLGKIDEEG